MADVGFVWVDVLRRPRHKYRRTNRKILFKSRVGYYTRTEPLLRKRLAAQLIREAKVSMKTDQDFPPELVIHGTP